MKEQKRALRATSRSGVRRIALNYVRATRHWKPDRVGESFFSAIESNAINTIKDRVNRHPTKGKTLK